MTIHTADAVVVGTGPNGLVAANALGDAGWDVVLVETSDDVGGAVRRSRTQGSSPTSAAASIRSPQPAR